MIRISMWTAVFLVLLRICIGWHFGYEGFTKVRSAYQGKGSGEKVFTSENYFRESEGPFGKLIKRQIGDPDQEVIDKLTLRPVDGDASDTSPASRFPEALAKEWDDYFNRFVSEFRLNDDQKTQAQTKFEHAKAKFVNWVQGNSDEMDPVTKKPKRVYLKVKRRAPGINNQSADYDVPEVTVEKRAADLKSKSEEVKQAYKTMAELGRDADATGARAKKVEVNTIRAELQKEIDGQTKSMKDSLAGLLDVRVSAYAAPLDDKEGAKTLAMLKPMLDTDNPLGKMWDEYAAYVKDFSPGISDEQKARVDEELRSAKIRFDRWLADKDMYTGLDLSAKDVAEWRRQFAKAQLKLAAANLNEKNKDEEALAKEEINTLTKHMQSELKSQSEAMRAQIGAPLLGEDRAKGYAPKPDERTLWIFPKNWSLIDYIDWSTRWFLLVVGVLLMIGLFTRLSCFAAAGFLLLTILTQPSVPWIPAAPMNEGSYLFVNKNVIEMVALIALMTTRSGKWAGLDAIVGWVFCKRERA